MAWALTELGLRSYVYASSVEAIGYTPVADFAGSPLPVINRFEPVTFTVVEAFGHFTAPSTDAFLVKSQVPSPLNQGPVVKAPGAFDG